MAVWSAIQFILLSYLWNKTMECNKSSGAFFS